VIHVNIYLVRHGKTADNHVLGDLIYGLDGALFSSVGTVLSGHNEVSLTIPGIVEAYLLGAGARAQIGELNRLTWIVSPQLRARQTFCSFLSGAEIFPAGESVFFEEGFRERSSGDLESITREVASRYWSEMSKGKDASVFKDVDACYPGGESLRMVYNRVQACLNRFLDPNADVIIFTHELTIKATLALLIENHLDNSAFAKKVPNSTIIHMIGTRYGNFMLQ
jgi:broad specificity phosphatase PhoE